MNAIPVMGKGDFYNEIHIRINVSRKHRVGQY